MGEGSTVTVLSSNSPPCVEAHYGVPGARAVLHTVNTRLDPATVAFMLEHAESAVLVFESEYDAVVRAALALLPAGARVPLLVEAALPGSASHPPYSEALWGPTSCYIFERLSVYSFSKCHVRRILL